MDSTISRLKRKGVDIYNKRRAVTDTTEDAHGFLYYKYPYNVASRWYGSYRHKHKPHSVTNNARQQQQQQQQQQFVLQQIASANTPDVSDRSCSSGRSSSSSSNITAVNTDNEFCKVGPGYSFSSSASQSSLYSEPTTLVNINAPSTEDSGFKLISPTSFDSSITLIEEGKKLLPQETDIAAVVSTFNHSAAKELGCHTHLHYYQLPFPWRENRYIINGYRFYASNHKCLLSIFNWYGMHNETMNIWTHLLGALYMAYLSIYQFPQTKVYQDSNVPLQARLIVYVFLLAATKCMVASVIWHTFNGTSSIKLRPKFCCVDYTGITILITASILTAEFIALYNSPIIMTGYMGFSVCLGAFGVFLNWSPRFDRPESRPLRIKFFILLASMGALTFVQLAYLENVSAIWEFLTPITKKSVVWYLVGVFFYGSFIPERFRKDYIIDDCIPSHAQLSSSLDIITKQKHVHFRQMPTKNIHCKEAHSFKSLWWVDYFLQSHTLWHLFVFFGVIGHYNAILEMLAKKWVTEAP